MSRIVITIFLLAVGFTACKKYEDKVGESDNRLGKTYCNDPQAVNFNWDFPGTPDNSTCFYADDLFAGTYILSDSVYYSLDYKFARAQTDTITISKKSIDSRTQLLVKVNNCTQMSFTADRFYKASADSIKAGGDTVLVAGQIFCRPTDTLTGFITKDKTDDKKLRVNFVVKTDSGSKMTFFVGTAVKQ